MATPPQSYPANSGYEGPAGPVDGASEFNAQAFLIRQILSQMATVTVVKVVGVTNAGGITPAGTVDVIPMVNQIDGAGNATPHGTIYKLPYSRLQGGANAVIIDPKVDDIGIVVFASHDISSVKSTRKVSNPGSRRRFDWADGIYIGWILNGTPTQYVGISDEGVFAVSPVKISLTAPIIEVHGELRGFGAIIAGFGGGDQIGVQTHTHTQGVDGHGDAEAPTAPPTPGT